MFFGKEHQRSTKGTLIVPLDKVLRHDNARKIYPFFLHYSSTSEACIARLHNLIVPLDKVLSLENTRENIFFFIFSWYFARLIVPLQAFYAISAHYTHSNTDICTECPASKTTPPGS